MSSSRTHLPIDSEPCHPTMRSEGSMDESVRASGAMAKTSRFLSMMVEFDKVPDDIQSCFELVRACHANVQKLIAKRNERIDLLTRRPNDLAHVNSVIEDALSSLQEVAAIVERSRPQASGGKTTFAKRFRWSYSDKESFRKHLPLVNHHHNAVSSEMAYLGQLGGTRTSGNAPERNPSFGRVENRRTFEDMGLLVDLLGGLSVPREGMKSCWRWRRQDGLSKQQTLTWLRATSWYQHSLCYCDHECPDRLDNDDNIIAIRIERHGSPAAFVRAVDEWHRRSQQCCYPFALSTIATRVALEYKLHGGQCSVTGNRKLEQHIDRYIWTGHDALGLRPFAGNQYLGNNPEHRVQRSCEPGHQRDQRLRGAISGPNRGRYPGCCPA